MNEAAEADLAEIWSYVAFEASETVANRLLDRIEATIQGLSVFPHAYPSREKLGKGLRVAFVGNYAIYYLVQNSEVRVARVLHGARDAAAISDRGGISSR